jgi:hypothetical protein
MHNWLNRETDALKTDIRSGKLQEAYKHLFTEPK